MDTAYRVRFTNWKDGKNEFFFTQKEDAEGYAESFKKYGYTSVVQPIYFEEKKIWQE
jgi:hypothetical protein